MRLITKVLIILVSTLPCAAFGDVDKNLLVRYTLDGKTHEFQGAKVKPNTYIWNHGAEKKIHITTLDWMPYIGETICKQGWVQQLTVAMLTAQGYEVTSTFYPWARTVSEAEKGVADLIYPEWYIESSAPSDVMEGKKRWDNLMLSQRIPGGPIAFMKRKDYPNKYLGDLNNLAEEKIGVVRGYQNTPEFDALMDANFFKVDEAKDDLQQAVKLLNGRNNLIINDPFVVRYTIQNSDLSDADKKNYLDNLDVVDPAIQYNYLYYAVSKNKENWSVLYDNINKAIQKFESTGTTFDIINATLNECGQNMAELFDPFKRARPAMK